MPVIPFINKSFEWDEIPCPAIFKWAIDKINQRLEDPKKQRKLILVIVSIALLLDNMLYMVIVPIIPEYLRKIGTWQTHMEGGRKEMITKQMWYRNATGNFSIISNISSPRIIGGIKVYENEESSMGFLFASKAIIQLMVNPFSGAVIDRIGYDMPMMIGLTIMFFSTAIFACSSSYGLLFFARSLQGVGSAFADTSGLAMIADRFTEETERTRALGIALAFISFGCLVAPPFGGLLYEFAGKEFPFLILSLLCLVDGLMLMFVMKPVKQQMKNKGYHRPKGTPIWRLLIDPQIAICAGALCTANISLAFMEPTISLWMMNTMKKIENWQMGMIWLPAFLPHLAGVLLTIRLARKYPRYQWFIAAIGLSLEGLSCIVIPISKNYWVLMVPISIICFGIALIDTALLPTLGYLVDVRYVSVYGSIYAIADISYSCAYAVGPIIAGGIVDSIGFTALNMLIALSNMLYVPLLWMLRHIYDYKIFSRELSGMPGMDELDSYDVCIMKSSAKEIKNSTESNERIFTSNMYKPKKDLGIEDEDVRKNLFGLPFDLDSNGMITKAETESYTNPFKVDKGNPSLRFNRNNPFHNSS